MAEAAAGAQRAAVITAVDVAVRVRERVRSMWHTSVGVDRHNENGQPGVTDE
jgi:hypothetical protein